MRKRAAHPLKIGTARPVFTAINLPPGPVSTRAAAYTGMSSDLRGKTSAFPELTLVARGGACLRSQRRDRAGVTPASIFSGRAGTRIPSLYYVSGKKASSGRLESILVIDRSSEKVYTGATIKLCVPGYGDTRCIEKGMQCKSAAAPATVTGTDHPSDATGKPGRRRGRMNWSQETCHIRSVLFFRRERIRADHGGVAMVFDAQQHPTGRTCPLLCSKRHPCSIVRRTGVLFCVLCFSI